LPLGFLWDMHVTRSFIENGSHQGKVIQPHASVSRPKLRAPRRRPRALRPAGAAWSPNPCGRHPAAGPKHGAGDAHVLLLQGRKDLDSLSFFVLATDRVTGMKRNERGPRAVDRDV